MIIIKICGGLGNQMFQYAAAKQLSLKYNHELRLDLNDYKRSKKRKYGLNIFTLTPPPYRIK